MARGADHARLLAAAVAGAGALVLPWAGLQLSPSLGARSIDLAAGSLPLLDHLSYALLVGGLLAAAACTSLRHGLRMTSAARWCGRGLVAVAVGYVVTTRLSGTDLVFRIGEDASETLLLTEHGLASTPNPPTSFFGFTFDPTTTLLLDSLRLGWYLTLASGLLLAGTHRLPRPGRAGCALLAVASLVATSVLAVGVEGQELRLVTLRAGGSAPPATVLGDAAHALAVLPQLDEDPAIEQAVGRADDELGWDTAASDYAEALAEQPGSGAPGAEAVELLARAASLDPGNVVIAEQLDASLAEDSLSAHGPSQLAVAASRAGSLVVAYTLGRGYYQAGDNPETISYMRLAERETDNAEVRSFALTYVGLAEDRLGELAASRRDIEAALAEDRQDGNMLVRDVAAGLDIPPGA